MSHKLDENDWRKVTPIGDAWIICKSKSHRGHIYYFNTLTGETAWNLSDAEIQKARKYTKKLESRPGAKPIKCPEPKGPPTPQKLPQSQKNKELQHLIPPFAKQPITNQIFPNIFNSTALNAPPEITKLPAFDALNLTGSLNINPIVSAPVVPKYNPNVWDVPPTQQIFIPSVAPIANYKCGRLSVDSEIRKSNPKHKFNLARNVNKPYGPLRAKLSKKFDDNKLFENTLDSKQEVVHNSRQQHESVKFPDKTEGTSCHEYNEDVIMNHRYAQTHEDTSKLDLSPLIALAPADANTDMWFIVVDLNVLLTEFKFLNNITDSDDKCHLMVPEHVMCQLKDYVNSFKDIQARRVLRFLSQQIDIGYALMANSPSDSGDNSCKIILETCIEQISKKYFLILLTYDDELLSYKEASNINVMSVIEAKNLLNYMVNNKSIAIPKQINSNQSLILENIKIVVPNNRHGSNQEEDNLKNRTEKVNISPELNNATKSNVSKSVKPKQNDSKVNNARDSGFKLIKKTIDAGIQTDFENSSNDKDVVNAVTKPDNTSTKVSENIRGSPKNHLKSIKIPELRKRREIKLKRSISSQPSGPADRTDKKIFKWRRRRNTTPAPINANKNNVAVTDVKETGTTKTQSANEAVKKKIPLKNIFVSDLHETQNVVDVSKNSDASEVETVYKTAISDNNVTIAETSTSDIISNSNSNIDDTEYNILHKTQKSNYVSQSHLNMNSINSDDMSDHWSVKCDEWISRFIQIMEEVLTIVLHLDPPFSNKTLPPPWTLHEAAQCIAEKFSYHRVIKDTANDLSTIIFNVSDAKGKIMMKMTLNQYTQMFSSGLYLLVALKDVTKNCEDLHIAGESLKNLLEDINNSNHDSSNYDIFTDYPQEYTLSPYVTEASQSFLESACEEQTNKTVDDDVETVEKQSPTENLEINKPTETVKFIRKIDIKSSFFNSLSLQRVPDQNINATDETTKNTEEVNTVQNIDTDIAKEKGLKHDTEIKNTNGPVASEPKIIRNFTICADIENKLKRKVKTTLFDEHDNDLDYEEDYGEYNTEDYLEDECSDIAQDNDNANHNGYDYYGVEENYDADRQEMSEALVSHNDNSNKFRLMTHVLIQRITDTLFDVKTLCDFCYEELEQPQRTISERYELIEMARTARTNLVKLCGSLESMLDEGEQSSGRLQELLKEADTSMCNVDKQLLLDFRITIEEYKTHTSVFVNSIHNIISALASGF